MNDPRYGSWVYYLDTLTTEATAARREHDEAKRAFDDAMARLSEQERTDFYRMIVRFASAQNGGAR